MPVMITVRSNRTGIVRGPLKMQVVPYVVCAVWKNGKFSEVLIPRAKIVVPQGDVPFSWVRQQFPLQLCFAMTINKSQGQTMESRVAVVLTSGVWTHGMLYVALGRVTDPDNLRVVAPKAPGDAVVNVVYADVLEVGEARRSTQVGQIEKSMDRSIRVDKIDRRADREE